MILGDRQNREERDRAALEAENQTLALRVAELERRTPVSVQGKVFSPAPLFSTYPFNYRNLLMIGIGDRDGVSIGDPVAVLDGSTAFFIGKIIQASASQSAVQTIFDGLWRSPVRVGEGKTNALLRGGTPTRVTLIAKEQGAREGDTVVSVSSDAPYGMMLGTLGTVVESRDGFYEEADLIVPYTLPDIETVFVIRAYAGE